MVKKALIGVLTFLFVAMSLTGCVKMPYEGGNFIEMPEDYEENIEEVEYEEPELEAIVEIEEEIVGLENETSEIIENDTEELTQFNIEQLEEDLPEGVFKKIVIDERETIDLEVNAFDPDGNTLIYTFTEPLDEEGSWETERGDAGEYITDIIVSDGDLETTAKVLIVVNSINKEPEMEEIENIVAQEGETITLDPSATDGNDDLVVYSYSGFMEKDTKKIGYDTVKCDEGIFECMDTFITKVTASDGFSEVSQDVGITVINTNRAPVTEPINDITVNELEVVDVDPVVTDPDGNEIDISFTSPLDDEGYFETERGDAGEYTVYMTATDGDLSTSEKFMLNIKSINKNPILAPMSNINVKETETIKLTPGAIDKNNDTITFEFSGWMDSHKYETTYDDAGVHQVTITAKDPYGGKDSKTINITVENVNRPPVILGVY
jgi:hypothetical protein